jgi:hypothetical protein
VLSEVPIDDRDCRYSSTPVPLTSRT